MHLRLAFLLASLQFVVGQGPMINTPTSVVQCQPTRFTFGQGTPPYYITLIPAGQAGAAPIADLGQTSDTSLTWVANLPANTAFTAQIRDSTGALNYAQAVTVQPSSDTSCMKAGASGSDNKASPAPSNNKGSPTPSPSPSPAGNNSSSGSASGASSSASKTPPASTSSSTAPVPAGSTTTNQSSTDQSKGPSPFSASAATNSSSPAAAGASNSAASGTSAVDSRSAFGGLLFASSVCALFV